MLGLPTGDNGAMSPEERTLLEKISSAEEPFTLLHDIAEDNPIAHFLFNQRYLNLAQYLSSKFERQLKVNETNANGEGLIHFIAQFKELNWLHWFSTLSTADLFLRTKTNQNVFHYSAHITDPLFLERLFSLTKSPEHIFCVNALDQSPLDLAIEYDNEAFFAYYILNFRKQTLNYVNSRNQNILHLMAKHNSLKCFAMLKSLITQEKLWELEFARDDMEMTPQGIAQEIAMVDADHVILHAILGYVDTGMKTLQWETALAAVGQRLAQVSVTAQAVAPSDPDCPYGNLLRTLPHLKPIFEHAYYTYQARKAAQDYQEQIRDQREEENPNFLFTLR